MNRPRVVIGDDHAMVVNGVRTLLEGHYDVAGSARDGRQLVEAAKRLKPDVIVADISMPLLNGIEAAKQIKADMPATKFVFLSMHANATYLRRALEAGAAGYVLKTGMAEELLEAIRAALEGEWYVTPGFGSDVLESWLNRSGQPNREERDLTGRQREVLQLVAEGRGNKEIAHVLGISVKTVEFHRGRIMSKLGARSVAELTRIAIEQGIIAVSSADTV